MQPIGRTTDRAGSHILLMLEMSFVMTIGLPFDLKISFLTLLEIRQVRVTLVVASELSLSEGGIGLSRKRRLLPTWENYVPQCGWEP